MFPIIRKRRNGIEKEGVTTYFTDHIWVGIVVILVLFYITLLVSAGISNLFLSLSTFYPYMFEYFNLLSLIGVALFNLSFFPLSFYLIPRILGLPYGKQRLTEYLINIKAGWLIKIRKILIWSFVGTISILIINFLMSIPDIIFPGTLFIQGEILFLILNFCSIFWQELFFRGIILTMQLRKRKNSIAIILNAFAIIIILILPQFIMYPGIFLFYDPLSIIMIFFQHIIFAFLFVKTKSIIPGIITRLTLSIILTGLPYVYILFNFSIR